MNKRVIMFWADGCMNCKAMEPTFDALGEEFSVATFEKLNIKEAPDLVRQFEIMTLPTTVFLKDEVLVDKLVGLKPKIVVAKKIIELFQ